MQYEILKDALDVAMRAAQRIVEASTKAIDKRGRFIVAFSGGTTPGLMSEQLAKSDCDWQHVYVTQVDERVAEAGSPLRNFTELSNRLLTRVRIPAENIIKMPVDIADRAAALHTFIKDLRAVAGTPITIDLVHLGLGDDGHVASLVPGDLALSATEDATFTAAYEGTQRMTLTYPALNRARQILYVVTGDSKATVVRGLLEGDLSLPASGVDNDRALLLVDRAAASQLSSP